MFFFKETKENFQVINRHLRGCSYSIPLFTDVFQGLDVKGGFFYEFMTQTQHSSHDHTKRANIEFVPLTLQVERDSHKRVNLKVIFLACGQTYVLCQLFWGILIFFNGFKFIKQTAFLNGRDEGTSFKI